MSTIKPNQAILLLLALFISTVFFAMTRYFFMSVLLAALFSALAMPLFNRFNGWGWLKGRRNLCAFMTILSLLFIVFLPLLALSIIVVEQAVSISRIAIPWLQTQLQHPAALTEQLRSLPFYDRIAPSEGEILRKAGELASGAGTVLFSMISSLTYTAVNDLFLIFVFLYTMFFFLRDGRMLLEKTLSFLPLAEQDQQRLLERFLSVTRAAIKGNMVVGIVQGTLAGLALHFAGIESAVFWGTIMSLISVIPVLGPPVVWVPAVIYLTATGQYPQAIGVLLFCSVVVGHIDNILRPMLIGRDTQMHELFIFFGTLGGIGLFGLFGFILGPIIAALFVTVWEMYGEVFAGFLREIKGRAPSDSSEGTSPNLFTDQSVDPDDLFG
ncbi:MAG: AI-2E family transporter [Chlorobiaceae bacterium]